MKRHLMIRVHGRVQGVFYRQTARREAERLGIAGFARNEPDGTVVIEAEGDPEALERFVAWCQVGPPMARVTRVEVQDGAVKGYRGFATH